MKKLLHMIPIVFAVFLLIAAGIFAVVWNINEFSLDVVLEGNSELTLEYGSEYTDPGAHATFHGSLLNRKEIAVDVAVEGNVDTSKVGDYILTYHADYRAKFPLLHQQIHTVQTRIVHIVDTQCPTITLNSIPGHYTLPNTPYVEEGFHAVDDYDGDITHLVEREEKDGQIIYRVCDSSGNTAELIRPIFYDDPIPPVLTLVETDVYVRNGKEYIDPGYTALDNLDGDITDQVTISGDMDTSVAGTYTLTYSVTDSYGNTVSAQREVIVLPVLPDIEIIFPNPALPPNGKVIYLTFDDGPSEYTPQLLDILAKYNVKATFFVVSNKYSDIITRIAAEGHTVAMHSATHNYDRIYSSEEAYFNDLYTIQSLIQGKTGTTPTMVRFPGGSSNSVSSFNPGIMTRLAQELTARGYQYYDWHVDSKDAVGATTTVEVLFNVVAGIGSRSVSVVLQHDTHEYSVLAVEYIIKWGLANGYTFRPLTEAGPTAHHRIRN